ncbi:unnamed protein product [marine sediment metagenome]|uniref:DUF4064 domain-containing protein n=1 Tax=marine sediment metagenome TaxID=412755 RepID=X1F2E1_9ZZZZ
MARKRDLRRWGQILAYTGGVLFALCGAVLFLSEFIDGFSLEGIFQDLILYTILFAVPMTVIVLGIIGVVIGAGIIILVGAEPPDLVTGILLIVFGIFGLGIPGIFAVVGGILFIIASTRKR